ncbi:MAG: polyprenol monophosphomannose synthase [bacterium]|nr:polyprenol monophosphomannose synthase [bacterium]
MLKPLIMIPTYNEAENIKILINEILSLAINCIILVVDDNSLDGTGDIVDKLSKTNAQIRIIHRKGKRGRGIAGIEGMLYALKENIDCIIEMDADLSHDPSCIPTFLKEIEHHDVVIGSRCIENGTEEGRTLVRKYISMLAHIYLKIVLGFKVTDSSSGYRCFRKSTLASLGLDRFVSVGPTIVTEILYAVYQNKFSIKEIPIVFKNRKFGRSKLNYRILLKSLLFPLRLRLKSILGRNK